MSALSIRRAHKGDEYLILTLLTELAAYEKLLDKFKITKDVIARDYLCEPPLLNCDLAYEGSAPVGICTWYWTYSSFAARRGICLLYTSDAADDLLCVDLGGRRIIKK